MKFDIEIVYTQEIIMGYNSFKIFIKKGVHGVKFASPPSIAIFFFLRLYEELTEYLMIKYYVISLEEAIDAIFILIRVHLGGSTSLRAPYLQTP